MVFTGFVGAESYDLVLNGKIGDEIEGYIEIENYYQGPIKVSMFNFDKEYGSKSGKYYSVEFDEEKQFRVLPRGFDKQEELRTSILR